MKKVKYALFGCGRVSQRYIEVFRDELANGICTVACDPMRERADAVAKALGAKSAYDFEETLNQGGFDAAIVLTESGYHFQHARRCLEAGFHTVVEKPICFRPAEVAELQALAEKKGLMLAPILQNRLNPAIRAVRRALDQARIGEVRMISVRLHWCRDDSYYSDGWHGTFRLDGGVIFQQALHHVDAMCHLMGLPEWSFAHQTKLANKLEAEDTTLAMFRFPGGALGTLEATTAARPRDLEASVTLLGTRGSIKVAGIALNEIVYWNVPDPTEEERRASELFSQAVPTGYGLSHGPLLAAIGDAILGGAKPPISASDATKALSVIHSLYRSAVSERWEKVDAKICDERLGIHGNFQ
jgi:predicted dehydrogenase